MNRKAIQNTIDAMKQRTEINTEMSTVVRTPHGDGSLHYISEKKLMAVLPHMGCNTSACICGWAIFANQEETLKALRDTLRQTDGKGEVKYAKEPSVWFTRIGSRVLDLTDSGPYYQYENLFLMTKVSTDELIKLADQAGLDIRSQCWTNSHNITMFDRLPADVRRKAGIKVLELLLETGEVDWIRAIAESLALEH